MKLNAACLQLTSNDQPNQNLDQVINLSEQAIQSGANFVLTPENTNSHEVPPSLHNKQSTCFAKFMVNKIFCEIIVSPSHSGHLN